MSFPLKWGTIGTCLSHCGFATVNNMIGEKDLFGREMQMTQVNVAEALAVAAVLEMGEVAEAQPLCLITDATMTKFETEPPTPSEIRKLSIDIEDDMYAPLLTAVNWKRNNT